MMCRVFQFPMRYTTGSGMPAFKALLALLCRKL